MLEPEQEDLLAQIVEAARSVPRHEQVFHLSSVNSAHLLLNPGLEGGGIPVLDNDVWTLNKAGLLEATSLNYVYGSKFVLTPAAYERYGQIKERTGEPAERTEREVRRFLESDAFRASYGEAHKRWADAEALLWKADSADELTTIGHKLREASQEFTTALVERYRPEDVDHDVKRVKNRIRAVIEIHRPKLGERRSAMLTALLDYWNATVDVIQRQEHGGQKGNEPLCWHDGRRAVFHTAAVMFEIAATLADLEAL